MDFAQVTNIGTALFMAVLTFVVQRLVRDLDQNTVETHKLAAAVGELNTSIARHYVAKTDFDALDARLRGDHDRLQNKFEALNREVGAITARMEHGVKHLKYD